MWVVELLFYRRAATDLIKPFIWFNLISMAEGWFSRSYLVSFINSYVWLEVYLKGNTLCWDTLNGAANKSELGTLEWDTFNPDSLVRISIVDAFNFLLNPLLFGYSTKKSKTGFSKLESPSCFCILILNGAQNFKFSGFWYATLIGWILYTFQDTSQVHD